MLGDLKDARYFRLSLSQVCAVGRSIRDKEARVQRPGERAMCAELARIRSFHTLFGALSIPRRTS